MAVGGRLHPHPSLPRVRVRVSLASDLTPHAFRLRPFPCQGFVPAFVRPSEGGLRPSKGHTHSQPPRATCSHSWPAGGTAGSPSCSAWSNCCPLEEPQRLWSGPLRQRSGEHGRVFSWLQRSPHLLSLAWRKALPRDTWLTLLWGHSGKASFRSSLGGGGAGSDSGTDHVSGGALSVGCLPQSIPRALALVGFQHPLSLPCPGQAVLDGCFSIGWISQIDLVAAVPSPAAGLLFPDSCLLLLFSR